MCRRLQVDGAAVGRALLGSTAKAVGLLHFTRIAQWVRRARMFGMQEDGKLGSNGITLRGDCLPEKVILYVLR
jgi:hypothetical protein